MIASKKTKIDTLIDELLIDCKDPKDVLGKHGLLKELTKRVVERVVEAELTEHLEYEKHDASGRGSGNNRNGKAHKTIHTESGSIDIEVPRDGNGSFEPKFVRKRQRRLDGFDEKVVALYSTGMSTREIPVCCWQAGPFGRFIWS